MDLLTKCKAWNATGKEWKTIDALEEVPEPYHTPELDFELAKAYYQAADPMDPSEWHMYMNAISLLESLDYYYEDDLSWNLLLGHSYKNIERYSQALPYLRTVLELDPDSEKTEDLIEECMKEITLPELPECFRERTEYAWNAFAEQEEELRSMLDELEGYTDSEDVMAEIYGILMMAFDQIAFEINAGKEKYEITLTPEHERSRLLELIYFKDHAPKEVLEHWDIVIGRQPMSDIGLCTEDGWEISGDDVQIWLEESGDSFNIFAYCEKLLPLFTEDRSHAWWMLLTLTSSILGELPYMRYIGSFDVLEKPKDSPAFLLSQLPVKLREKGLDLTTDPNECIDTYIAYEVDPDTDPDADLRLDIIAGITGCMPLLNEYINGENELMDSLKADGAVAGFFVYPLEALGEGNAIDNFYEFSLNLEEMLSTGDYQDILTPIGFSAGIHFGYMDFIAWDLIAVLDKAKAFFESSDIPWAAFHTFYRDAGAVILKAPSDDEQTDYSRRN